MKIHEIQAKSLIRRHRRIDSWFISKYGMNLYRGCTHNCVYCDGRNEKYQVQKMFGTDVEVKINAISLLQKELSLQRRQKYYKNGFIMVGGGVGDSYQHAEETYKLTRKTLEMLNAFHLPVHILTKSTLVTRDIDVLKEINEKTKALISFSFSSTNDELSKMIEPGVSLPSERLTVIKQLKKEGFHCGVFLLPVIPFLTDTLDIMKRSIQDFHEAGIDYLLFGGMTLKTGRQKTFFYQMLSRHFPSLIPSYEMIYQDDKWGNPIESYHRSINQTFHTLMKHYPIPKQISAFLFNEVVTEHDRIVLILQQMDYLLKSQQRPSPYGYAAYNISKIKEKISLIKHDLQQIKGVGKVTENIILEIIETKSSTYYEKLLFQ